MVSWKQAVITSAILAVVQGQGVLLKAQGNKNSPASLSLQVNADDDADANFISDTEIGTNVVNECGRTLAGGNIDIGEQTENALADNQVTQTQAGDNVKVTIRQVNETGAGPYTCDLDLTGNSNGLTGQTKLTVQESDADGNGNIKLSVAMPNDMACIGASTGDVCTVRCRNAESFGGCFAVQQTDTTPSKNTPANIVTAQTLEGITDQVQQNIADLPAAVDGIAGADLDEQGTAVVDSIQAADPSTDGLDEEAIADGDNTGNGNNNNNNNNGNNNNNNNGNGNDNSNSNGNGGNNGFGNGESPSRFHLYRVVF
ncbi:hypothetical protein MGN70_011289 [Eutypa lata]|nr:hypothetical protein MGN70_011289 [Eutypa lata]